jgi:hypothetical protein
MKRPRFTVRRLMVAVAIVGVGAGFSAMRQRAAARQGRAAGHAAHAAELRAAVANWRGGNVRLINITREQAEAIAKRSERSAAHHEAMRRKWEEADRSPWLPVEPDPPEPQPPEPE